MAEGGGYNQQNDAGGGGPPLAPPAAAMAATGQLGATMGATMKGKGGGECVKVVVRARPLFGKEIAEGREKIVVMDAKRGVAILQKPGGSEREAKDFTFDAVFDETFSQQQIFEDTALEIVDNVMEGFNGTIFAYGQTGAGKSHTMTGPDNCSEELSGLIPRAFKHVFNCIAAASDSVKYLVRGSYLEIYNEQIRDLLSRDSKANCELKDSKDSGVYVKDLSAFVVKTAEEMNKVMEAGLKNRSVGATAMNEGSSRSHSIFMVTVEQCSMSADGEAHIRVGKLNMVDLAGSERQSKTQATGERLKEATKINLSLSALGNVISALVDGKSSHIPYRDSKLTRLLQDSLGGNTKTVMVANCGPADYNYDETGSTLRYAYRAKSIKNKPKINEDPKDAMIREFQEEIMRLKAEMADGGGGGGVDGGGEVEYDDDGEPIPGGPAAPNAPLAPRIEKQVEYVEKVLETVVEREVIVEKAASHEELESVKEKLRQGNEVLKQEADRKRQEVVAQLDIAESERKRLFAEIDREEKIASQEAQRKVELEGKLLEMEGKMMAGKTVMEKAIEQEEELKRRQKELKKQNKIEAKLKEQEEIQKMENMELEDKCATQEEQVGKLTAKLQKLWDKNQKSQQELVDVQQFNQGEREDMLSMIRDLRQTLKLKTLIMESFVPLKEVQGIQDRSLWDPEEDEWSLQPARTDKDARPVRPGSALGCLRPTCELARVNRQAGDPPNARYMFDSIVHTDLDLPERTTEDYEVHPELGDRIERALMLALSAEDEEGAPKEKEAAPEKSDRPSTGKRSKRPSSGRPGTGRQREEGDSKASAFPQARGLVSRE